MSPEVAGAALAGVVGALVLAVAWFLIRNAGRLVRIDLPDARRLHQAPTPRGGGLAMPFAISGAAAAWVLLFEPTRSDLLLAVLAFALPNGILGVIDDYRPLRSRVKFGVQGLLAIGVTLLGWRVESIALPGVGAFALGPLSYPFTVLWLIWATNVYNFMDGMDGLAAGSGAAFFATLGLLAWLVAGSPTVAWTAAMGAAACLGFLVVNFPPARIFMGDGGALYIGALLGLLAVMLTHSSTTPVPFPAAVLAMGSFMWDATYTILMRVVRREDWLHPHKRHLFQRLVTAGWSHSRVRWLYAFLAVVGSGTALGVALGGSTIVAASLAVACVCFGVTSYATERAERRATDR